jgi:hypothetical protein
MRLHESLTNDMIHELVTGRVLMTETSVERTFQVVGEIKKYATFAKTVIIVRHILTDL